MTVVMDASAALSIVGTYEPSPLGRVEQVIVPDLYVAEVTSAVWKNHKFLGMPLNTCNQILDQLLRLPTEVIPMADVAPDVLQIAAETGHSSYDLFYLVLAQQTGAKLFTKDKALARLAHKYKVATA